MAHAESALSHNSFRGYCQLELELIDSNIQLRPYAQIKRARDLAHCDTSPPIHRPVGLILMLMRMRTLTLTPSAPELLVEA